ncbi:MAG: PIN domain-containing protein [Cyanothece sp. SIO2G6]|nr:PIN domain-containing protein [Cyanothece sp. SIO2G6]
MERVIADTSFVVALTNQADVNHGRVTAVYANYSQIFLPQLTLVEIAYLLGRNAGISCTTRLLQQLPMSRFTLISATDDDIQHVASILHQYMDSQLDFVDAVVMAIAERLNIQTVLTLDQRDFRMFRPKHCEGFTIYP